jgi:hypothetical protein
MENKITPEQALDFLYKATCSVNAPKQFHDQSIACAMVLKELIESKKQEAK